MRRAAVALMALALLGPLRAEPLPEPAVVEQPRAFGYQLGDRVHQRVRLDTPERAFVPGELPPPERANVWFERQALVIEQDPDGRRWLRADYQLVNSPPRLRIVNLPGWVIPSADGGPGLQVPDWPVSAAPLGRETAFSESGLGELRPDRLPAVPDIAPLAARRNHTLLALAAMLAAWAGWWAWRQRRERDTLPFAHAAAALRHIAPDDPAAWQALHRAFDAAAGRVIDAATVPALFERRPELRPLSAQIEQFYAASAARFFAGREVADAPSPHALCQALRQRERTARG
ncbi:MAG: hypothetical protein KDH20_17725 [Rhodocyclaceae bacterium]|nr:hypothetical protein [Rhodocyclaceae bacterium]